MKEAEQSAAEARLAAEQVRRAGQVEPQAIRPGDARGRRPAPDCMQGQPVEQGAIVIRLGIAHVEIGDKRAGMRAAMPGRKPSSSATGQAAVTTSRWPMRSIRMVGRVHAATSGSGAATA